MSVSEQVRKRFQQLLCEGRTAAPDLHDIVYLFADCFDDFDANRLDDIGDLYDNQSMYWVNMNVAYNEDNILITSDLLND